MNDNYNEYNYNNQNNYNDNLNNNNMNTNNVVYHYTENNMENKEVPYNTLYTPKGKKKKSIFRILIPVMSVILVISLFLFSY